MAYAGAKSLVVVSMLVLGSWGCSGAKREADAVGTAGNATPITIETTSLFVTVENHTTTPFTDVRVTINPVGRPTTTFSSVISRIEPGEKRDLSLGNFRGSDGSAFNTMFLRPKTVSVSAVDLDGKKYETTAPWRG